MEVVGRVVVLVCKCLDPLALFDRSLDLRDIGALLPLGLFPLSSRERDAEPLLKPAEREIARHTRGLGLMHSVGDDESLAFALKAEAVSVELLLQLGPGASRPQLRQVRPDAVR